MDPEGWCTPDYRINRISNRDFFVLPPDLGLEGGQVDDGVHGSRRTRLRRRVSSARVPSGVLIAGQNRQLLGLGVLHKNFKLRQGHGANQVIYIQLLTFPKHFRLSYRVIQFQNFVNVEEIPITCIATFKREVRH